MQENNQFEQDLIFGEELEEDAPLSEEEPEAVFGEEEFDREDSQPEQGDEGFEEDPEEQPEDDETGEDTIPVRFNHREMRIPISEAAALIQKGLNYDKVISERDRLRSYTAPRGEGALKDEFDAFSRNFPQVAANPGSIPETVWEDFRRGMPLSEAWLKNENSRLAGMVEAERAQSISRARITRSARGRGSGHSFDGFLEGFSGD